MARKERATEPSKGRRSSRRHKVVDPRSQTVLTPDGFSLIEERIADIRLRRLPELRPLLVDQDRDERNVAAFEALLAEADAFEALLAEGIVMEVDQDCSRVSLGSWVLVRMPDGSSEWVRPVHPSEAFLDDERISIASPLGSAILDAQVGSTVTIEAPAGRWTATVIEVRSLPVAKVLQPN
jgi:transcription elongation GreA/GreB family factor